jgi:hypothetical protein
MAAQNVRNNLPGTIAYFAQNLEHNVILSAIFTDFLVKK